jgi:glycogen synthase
MKCERIGMRILMPTFEYDVIKTGGLSAALTSIAEILTLHVNPVVAVPKSGGSPPWKKIDEVRYKKVTVENFEHNGVKIHVLSNKILDNKEIYPDPKNTKTVKKIDEFGNRLREIVEGIDFDLVHMHDSFGYKAMDKFKEMEKPILLTIHRLHRECPNWFKTELVALDKADFVTVVGKTYYQENEKELFSKYGDKVAHVYNGIDTEFWSVENCSYPGLPREKRREKQLGKYDIKNGIFYLFVGRLDASQKGVDLLLRAGEKFIKNKESRMIIVGTGEKKLEIASKNFERRHPNKVRVINELLPTEETRDLFCSADFALVPSIFEPFGLVQLEAMCYGCVPIGSKTGGILDTVVPYPRNGATGLLFEKGSANALLQAMEKSFLLYQNNREEIEMMRKNGRKRCETSFRWENSCRKYLRIYKRLLKEKK